MHKSVKRPVNTPEPGALYELRDNSPVWEVGGARAKDLPSGSLVLCIKVSRIYEFYWVVLHNENVYEIHNTLLDNRVSQ